MFTECLDDSTSWVLHKESFVYCIENSHCQIEMFAFLPSVGLTVGLTVL